ncbi:hypothetical protein TEA_003908 [Camellia sinensis var. sinensis]|uniref:Uncharacterized protein n=1 Tax=Camellia sinensis var. sinensis TaxID=542762 RepID=A0A4S4EC94_CAMSN|nr:hypothetical protein TEA_003908 [Camellia sinensis var. sinensis]
MSDIDGNIIRNIIRPITEGLLSRGVQLHQTRKMKRPLRSRQENSSSFDLKRKMKQATTRVRQAQRKSSPSSDDRPNRRYPIKDDNENEPVGLSLFLQLENELSDLSINSGIRTYAYFMYHNRLFDNRNYRYNMIHKSWDYSMAQVHAGGPILALELASDHGPLLIGVKKFNVLFPLKGVITPEVVVQDV